MRKQLIAIEKGGGVNTRRSQRWVVLLASVGLLAMYLSLATVGQFWIEARVRAPWRDIVVVATLPLEYAGLVQWSAWMVRSDRGLARAQATEASEGPVVLACAERPTGEAIDQASRVARAWGRPVLLLALIEERQPKPAWIESASSSLQQRRLQVSTRIVLSDAPERRVAEMARATGALCVVWGQARGLQIESVSSGGKEHVISS